MDPKAALRAEMRTRRRRLAVEAPDAAERAAANLPANGWPDIEVYGLYHPVGSELDPTPIRLKTGRRALPVVVSPDAPLVFRLHGPNDPLTPDALGIPAPTAAAPQVWPDIVFAPLLAFDRRGGRLGQGGGHYDRTIADLRARKAVLVIGLAYAGQEVDDIPMAPHDQRLDAILTETAYVPVR
ncbi:5-formyltetrahydrofolate cyclo-ligase [Phenylobacterium sp.]|uniref:5-formyltetrahydrofolate cyclo-ligase n=1 Tax=Phenylobacterium sp. TaxID=1871053 RepID=UPI0025DC1482|nr:5-formyltetrahydrofolate cyclo-ligase [Phenylobacterium sp.]